MHMRRNLFLVMVTAIVLGSGMVALAAAQDDEGPTSALRFVVVRDSDGKPVRNAEVVLHPVKRKGKQAKGEMELKTDAEGRTNVDGIPYGQLRVQVLAPHFQTFGEDYEINKAEMEITVKLKRPAGSTRCMRITGTRRSRSEAPVSGKRKERLEKANTKKYICGSDRERVVAYNPLPWDCRNSPSSAMKGWRKISGFCC